MTTMATRDIGKWSIRCLQTSLLERPAIQALHVLQRPQVDSLSAMTTDNPRFKNNVISDDPQLFTGLGEMHGTPHHIHLADNATPYSLCAPRRVPVPLIAKVDDTLGKMESQGIIRQIDEPTEWYAAWPAMRVISLGIRTVPVLSVAKKLAATLGADEAKMYNWLIFRGRVGPNARLTATMQ